MPIQPHSEYNNASILYTIRGMFSGNTISLPSELEVEKIIERYLAACSKEWLADQMNSYSVRTLIDSEEPFHLDDNKSQIVITHPYVELDRYELGSHIYIFIPPLNTCKFSPYIHINSPTPVNLFIFLPHTTSDTTHSSRQLSYSQDKYTEIYSKYPMHHSQISILGRSNTVIEKLDISEGSILEISAPNMHDLYKEDIPTTPRDYPDQTILRPKLRINSLSANDSILNFKESYHELENINMNSIELQDSIFISPYIPNSIHQLSARQSYIEIATMGGQRYKHDQPSRTICDLTDVVESVININRPDRFRSEYRITNDNGLVTFNHRPMNEDTDFAYGNKFLSLSGKNVAVHSNTEFILYADEKFEKTVEAMEFIDHPSFLIYKYKLMEEHINSNDKKSIRLCPIESLVTEKLDLYTDAYLKDMSILIKHAIKLINTNRDSYFSRYNIIFYDVEITEDVKKLTLLNGFFEIINTVDDFWVSKAQTLKQGIYSVRKTRTHSVDLEVEIQNDSNPIELEI